MQSSVGLSTCPKCQAIYHVLKVEGTPDAKDEGATCQACGAPLPTPQRLQGEFVLKYFLMREGTVKPLE